MSRNIPHIKYRADRRKTIGNHRQGLKERKTEIAKVEINTKINHQMTKKKKEKVSES